ncbi:YqzE family protein [Bacillus sp. WMMC1349]|uniref:YqzE family protein n=1 Tax=Bacillus sp. WMMC1349 TaxID=2736254 RepID=UPI00155689D7|nr:YqzE family protein [Bacillus sp. WMMC1349]NPC93293.1 YqzE family protein [Bacillus sp. WMMC1349]
MKTNDYVKYMTEQLVKYMDTPKQERKQLKEKRKEARPSSGSYRWLGILPMGCMMLFKRRK